MSDSCSTCFFFRSFNVPKVVDRVATLVATNVCARNAPQSGQDDVQSITTWPEIIDPTNWWCGDFLQTYPADAIPVASGPGYLASSNDVHTVVSSGSITVATQAGLAYSPGARVRMTSITSGAYMEGVCTEYAGGTLVFTVDNSYGSGTLTGWSINLAGDVGSAGAASGLVLLNTLTASASASLPDTTHITATYDTYMLTFDNLVPSDATFLYLQVTTDAGATWKTTSYFDKVTSFGVGVIMAPGVWGASDTMDNVATSVGLSGSVYLYAPNSTNRRKLFSGTTSYKGTTGFAYGDTVAGYWDGGNDAINGVRVVPGSGTITSGHMRVYGVGT